MCNIREKESILQLWLYKLCCRYSIWKRVFKGSLLIFNCFLINHIKQNKANFYIIKNALVWPMIFHLQKSFVWRYSAYFSPCFNVHNNLFWIHVRGICTSDSKGQLKYSLQSTYIVSSYGRAGRVDSFSIIFHAPWVKINKLDIAGKYLSFIQSKAN